MVAAVLSVSSRLIRAAYPKRDLFDHVSVRKRPKTGQCGETEGLCCPVARHSYTQQLNTSLYIDDNGGNDDHASNFGSNPISSRGIPYLSKHFDHNS